MKRLILSKQAYEDTKTEVLAHPWVETGGILIGAFWGDDMIVPISIGSGPKAKRTWSNFQQKELHKELLMAYGYGDGGGGPTREMLENIEIMGDFSGLPSVRPSSVADFFEAIEPATASPAAGSQSADSQPSRSERSSVANRRSISSDVPTAATGNAHSIVVAHVSGNV